MPAAKADIIEKLRNEILPLQGFRSFQSESFIDPGLGPVNDAFPHRRFPIGAIHEFISSDATDLAATTGFISGIVSSLMQGGGVCFWISSNCSVFPPALASFGIEPDKVIFVNLRQEKEVLWCVEETLKCNGLSAVIGELKELSFTASRRLQLAVEQSRVTGFIHRHSPRNLQQNACVTRWKIRSAAGMVEDHLPGVGHPCWNVELLKVRNGKTGNWKLGWVNNTFFHELNTAQSLEALQRKTG